MDVTSITAASASAAGAAASQEPRTGTGAAELGNADTFLKLLVAQMKNQDPMKPQDGTQFLAQLAQFSQLEQLIGIRQELATLSTDAASGATAQQTTTNPPAASGTGQTT